MGSPEVPGENAGPKPETPEPKVEKTYTDAQELWKALEAERDRRNLTQTSLAKLVELKGTTVSVVLTELLDGNWPTQVSQQKTLAKMAEELGISYSVPADTKPAEPYRTPRGTPQRGHSGRPEYRSGR